ncbi:XVIPCD domain-containing protein [Stenotrophomonas maltophilia]|uniref:XVIPCD domain-containing protein n=1 Tax=Stenotrophomonas maltophilia TaxID=40324 RepID=UPI001FA71E9F|nr:XVIPCD domain-containing protein [Stenotrophomonas maltophilia]
MSKFVFDDFALATLGGAKNTSDGSPLSAQQKQEIIAYLKSSESGPDGVTSYAEYIRSRMQTFPPELNPGVDYLGFSATDRNGVSNFENAVNYAKDINSGAGIIGDTPWGTFIEEVRTAPLKHPDFQIMERGLERFMNAQGTEPWSGNYRAALQDMMWNAGSPKFFENAIATGKPLVAFVENAQPGRGFDKFELGTALDHPTVRINGYPISAFGPEPLAFASQSAAEYQALERSLAQHATTNSAHPVDVAQVRLHLKPIDGYDAVSKTLFERPLHDYSTLNLSEMSTTRANWVAAHASLGTGPRLFADLPEPPSHAPLQPGAPRGPPHAATVSEAVADVAPHGMHAGINPAIKVAGVAGVALLAHDFATSGHKWIELNSQGNAAGADSTAAHFVGRNVGGALGGFLGGAGVGLASGSWTGPGAIATGIGGGVLGAYLGERWAEQKDIERVYSQVDPMGRTWTRDPADPNGRWLRAGEQQQVQSSDLGTGVEVRPVQTAQGDDVTFRTSYVATGTLERQLNWQAARASYELGLSNPPPPQNPYRLNANGLAEPARGAFETDRAFVRDASSGQWELEIKEMVDGRVPNSRHLPVSAEQAQALDEQSRTVIAQNASNTKAAMAARYMVAHEQGRWSDFGDANNPSVPHAVQDAQASADTLKASDGNAYTRQADGQWVSKGVIFDNTANRNLSDELEITWQSQNDGIAGLHDIARQLKDTAQIAPEGIRGQVDALYARHGIERTEQQLAATAVAVEKTLNLQGRTGDVVLELMPDPRTHAPSAESAIATFGDAGGNRMVLTGTTTIEDIERAQSQLQPKTSLAAQDAAPADQATTPDIPELRITALTANEQDAHRQALQEANRQGSAAVDAQHATFAAVLEARGLQVDPVETLKVDNDLQRGTAPSTAVAPAREPAPAPTPVIAAPSVKIVEPEQTRPSRESGQRVESRSERQADSAQRAEDAAQQDTRKDESVSTSPTVNPHSASQQGPNVEHARPTQNASRADAATIAASTQPVQMQEPKIEPPVHLGSVEPQQLTGPLPAQPTAAANQGEAEKPLPRSNESEHAPSGAQEVLLDLPASPPLPRDSSEQEAAGPRAAEVGGDAPHQAAPHSSRSSEDRDLVEHVKPELATLAERNPMQPSHPDHALYLQIREGVEELDAKHGRSFDEASERMTASLLVLAKDNDLSRVDHVLVSNATATHPAGHTLFVVQGEASDPAHLRASMPTAEAAQTPVEESLLQFDSVSREAQQRALANQQEQLLQDERAQQDIQIRAASMG